MSTTQPINNQRLSGAQVFMFTNTPPGTQWIEVDIDRTVNGGLNSLTAAATLDIHLEKSIDGGASWFYQAGFVLIGGTYVTKGVTQTTDEITIGVDVDNTAFRITTTASTPVRIAGTVLYLP